MCFFESLNNVDGRTSESRLALGILELLQVSVLM
jgi:hypothetical protein